MPLMSWRESQYTLPLPATDIGEVYGAIAATLPSLGYTNVQKTDHIHAVKGDLGLTVHFLFITGRSFWLVISTAANTTTQAVADAEIAKVQQMVLDFAFY